MSLSNRLKALVQEHAKYDPEVARHAPVSRTKPLYLQDMEERAARQGKTLAEVRAQDQQLLASSAFPSPQCLKAGEVLLAALGSPDLRLSRQAHHDSCLYCQAVVASSRPDENAVTQMSQILAQPAEEGVPQRQSGSSGFRWVAGLAACLRAVWLGAQTVLPVTVLLLAIVLGLSETARREVTSALAGTTRLSMQENQWLLDAYRSSSQGDDSATIQWTTRVLKADPKNIDALLLRGDSWMKRQELERAKQDYEAVLKLEPSNKTAAEAVYKASSSPASPGRNQVLPEVRGADSPKWPASKKPSSSDK